VHAIAWHRDGEGRLLDTKVARVELINVLRPTVAVARFICKPRSRRPGGDCQGRCR